MPEPIIDLLPADRPQPPRTNRAKKEEDDGPAFRSFLNEEAPAANEQATPAAAAEKPTATAEAGGKSASGDTEPKQTATGSASSEDTPTQAVGKGQAANGDAAANGSPVQAAGDVLQQNAVAGISAEASAAAVGNAKAASQQPNAAQQSAAVQATPAEAAGPAKLAATDTRQPVITPPQAPQAVPKAPSAITPDDIPEGDAPDIRIDLAGKKKPTATAASALLGEGLATKPLNAASGATAAKSGAQAAVAALVQSPDLQAAASRGAQDPATLQLTRASDAAQPIMTQPVETAQPLPTAQQSATPQINPTSATGQASFAQQMAQSAAPQPAQQLGVSIVRAAREGMDRIDIQLHPAELGRVEVKMELGHDGRIIAVVSAERADTLDQLRRDINQLEKALADAGFDTDGDSFRFDDGNTPDRDGGEAGHQFAGDDESLQIADAALASRTLMSDRIGVDISV